MGNKKFGLFSAFNIDREEAKKTGKFFLWFVIVFAVFEAVLSLIPAIAIQKAVADAELGILSVFGISGNVSLAENAMIALSSGVSIQISDLCTGALELMILVSAIIASIGINWKKRIIGAAAGAVVAIAFNFARITATVLIIVSTTDLAVIEFAHNVLFRIFLFFVIAVSYIAWFYWAVKEKKK